VGLSRAPRASITIIITPIEGESIDPDGVIQAMEVLTPEVGRNVSELIRQVKAYQHVKATGEVTPSGWQPGKPALKPGPALVGKVWEVWQPEMAF
jgi:hypothetical protein